MVSFPAINLMQIYVPREWIPSPLFAFVALEEEFDIEIPDEKLLLAENTVSKITDVISSILKVPYEADSYVDE